MKRHSELLDDVLAEERALTGPSIESVIAGIHHEKQRRRKRRGMLVSAAFSGFAVAALLTHSIVSTEKPALVSLQTHSADAQAMRQSIVIERVDDAELLDLLAGTPVALMESPDGHKQLLMLVSGATSEVPSDL